MSIPTSLADEITSLNSIYTPTTLTLSPESQGEAHQEDPVSVTLTLPITPLSFLLLIPQNYPSFPPTISRVTHIDPSLPKGTGNQALILARTILQDLTSTSPGLGEVILFDLIEALEAQIAEGNSLPIDVPKIEDQGENDIDEISSVTTDFIPEWILSDPAISHKSTFLARACAVTDPEEASSALKHLLATDKRVTKATHNMWAYRMRGQGSAVEVIYADADDDGEDGAGLKLAALLQAMGAWGVLVVVSRWYGGIKLGPERWRLIGSVGREAVMRGGQARVWKVERT